MYFCACLFKILYELVIKVKSISDSEITSKRKYYTSSFNQDLVDDIGAENELKSS